MAYSTIPKPSLHFNTKLYSGTGSTNAITGVGFQPDWTWIKARDHGYGHHLQDAVRGTGKDLYSESNAAEYSNANSLTTFGSDGFTVGSDNGVNNGSKTYASWNWKANGTGSANTAGSINSTVSVNTTAGFSIVSYTGNGSNATIGHGLGVTPKTIIVKKRNASAGWFVNHGSLSATQNLYLNDTASVQSDNVFASRGTSTFGITSSTGINNSGDTFIAYCFAEKTGYSKFGSYTGNGNADGTFVYTGFKPAFVMVKNVDSGVQGWLMFDDERPGYNVTDKFMVANLSQAEATSSNHSMDLLSNGFKIRGTDGGVNGSGNNIIYMAFAEEPLVANSGTNGVPATAR